MASNDVSPSDVSSDDRFSEALSLASLQGRLPVVLDLAKSHGVWAFDASRDTELLDCHGGFGSNPLGFSPPSFFDPEFQETLLMAARFKPACSDFSTMEELKFRHMFQEFTGLSPENGFPWLFTVDTGTLSVENGLKAAFDFWAQRMNRDNILVDGPPVVLHLEHCFHGRSGYTMSLSCSDPIKVARYPRFDWPRIPSPALHFPKDLWAEENRSLEDDALAQAVRVFERFDNRVAVVIVECVQGEGGDRHLSARFLNDLQSLARANNSMFMVDEVQTGMSCGAPFCFQTLGLSPDLVAFSKKYQLGGVVASSRFDEFDSHVFNTPGRLNSTWGGNFVDMVRTTRIMETVQADGLLEKSRHVGKILLDGLQNLASDNIFFSNPRASATLAAVDVPHGSLSVFEHELLKNRMLILPAGRNTVRLRPPLVFEEHDVKFALDALFKAARATAR